MPLKGVRYRVTRKGGKKIRLAFRGKGKVVEAKNLVTGTTHTPREFAQDAAQTPDEMGQVHVGLRMTKQPKRPLGKFIILLGIAWSITACATVSPHDPTQQGREDCWARGGFTVETAQEGLCLPLHLLPGIFGPPEEPQPEKPPTL